MSKFNDKPAILVCIFGNKEEALKTRSTVLHKALAVSGHISKIDSVWLYNKQLDSSPEYRLELRTTLNRCATIDAIIKDIHSYETYELFAYVPEYCNHEWEKWITQVKYS